jgi:PhnB protein
MASVVSTAAVASIPVRLNARSQSQTGLEKPKEDDMASLTPYLLFDGTCAQAMEFYKAVLGGELSIMKVKDSPAKDRFPSFQQDKVINSHLESGAVALSASDWLMPEATPIRGNTVCMFLHGGSLDDLRAMFKKLSDGAKVTNPLSEQFFGTYGALNDRFGVRWMFQTNSKD